MLPIFNEGGFWFQKSNDNFVIDISGDNDNFRINMRNFHNNYNLVEFTSNKENIYENLINELENINFNFDDVYQFFIDNENLNLIVNGKFFTKNFTIDENDVKFEIRIENDRISAVMIIGLEDFYFSNTKNVSQNDVLEIFNTVVNELNSKNEFSFSDFYDFLTSNGFEEV